ncbi:MAG: hypothetical protein JWM11_655 [Planctomycetaceae bacterium]|nr:hypothetical protein [Planctomycetaceae bacterium]
MTVGRILATAEIGLTTTPLTILEMPRDVLNLCDWTGDELDPDFSHLNLDKIIGLSEKQSQME